jgi:hypothetical protein
VIAGANARILARTMKFSEGRLSYLAHRIAGTLKDEGLARIENERLVLAEIKRVLGAGHDLDTQIDITVRRKIASLSRQVPPGSREWDILYQKYFAEERRKQKS